MVRPVVRAGLLTPTLVTAVPAVPAARVVPAAMVVLLESVALPRVMGPWAARAPAA